MLRRFHVESDDVGGFLFEVRIVASHVAIQPVRFEASLPPNALHAGFAQSESRRHLSTSPVRAAVIRRLSRLAQNARLNDWRNRACFATFMSWFETRNALLFETAFPTRDSWPGGLKFNLNLTPGLAFR